MVREDIPSMKVRVDGTMSTSSTAATTIAIEADGYLVSMSFKAVPNDLLI
jgi:hypothetical protein